MTRRKTTENNKRAVETRFIASDRKRKTDNRKQTTEIKKKVKKMRMKKVAEVRVEADAPEMEVMRPTSEMRIVERLPQDKLVQQKKTIMWVGVSLFMLFIVVLWGFNMKSMFNRVEASDNSSKIKLNEVTNDLSEVMSKLEISIDEFKKEFKKIGQDQKTASGTEEQATEENVETTAAIEGEMVNGEDTEVVSPEAGSTGETGELTPEEAEQLKLKLKLLEQELK